MMIHHGLSQSGENCHEMRLKQGSQCHWFIIVLLFIMFDEYTFEGLKSTIQASSCPTNFKAIIIRSVVVVGGRKGGRRKDSRRRVGRGSYDSGGGVKLRMMSLICRRQER